MKGIVLPKGTLVSIAHDETAITHGSSFIRGKWDYSKYTPIRIEKGDYAGLHYIPVDLFVSENNEKMLSMQEFWPPYIMFEEIVTVPAS